MIDVHCHILPGIDDGSKSFDESIAILKKAEVAGISDVILTPHYIFGTDYNADNKQKYELLKQLNEQVKKENIKINLFLGNEIFIDGKIPDMLLLQSYEIASLNSNKYVLIELPVRNEDKSAPETLFELIRNGYVPIIAHPERYEYIQKNLKYAEELVRIGCVLQGDYLALTGKYGRNAEKTLRKLLRMNLIFCLASDIHHERDDYKLGESKKKLKKIMKDEGKIDELFVDNPRKILIGK